MIDESVFLQWSMMRRKGLCFRDSVFASESCTSRQLSLHDSSVGKEQLQLPLLETSHIETTFPIIKSKFRQFELIREKIKVV